MLIISKFIDDSSSPITGLVPTIKIYNLSTDTVSVNNLAMIEVSAASEPGWYKYEFSTVNASYTYTIDIDGGASLDESFRYQDGIISSGTAQIPVVDFGS